MSQATYNYTPAIGQAGDLFDLSGHSVSSYFNTDGALDFGLGVMQGTDDDECVVYANGATVPFGVTMRSDVQTTGAYPAGSICSILTRGRILVSVEEAVVPGPAYCRHTANAPYTTLGRFRGDNDSGNAAACGTFRTSADADELAVLEINIP